MGASVAALLSVPALSAPAAIAPGVYAVDSQQTNVAFSVRQFAISRLTGQFVAPTGALVVDAARPDRARIDISFPIARLTTGKPSADRLLKGGTMFDAARYPQARFVASNVPIGGATATVEGTLMLHGVTRPLSFPARLTGARTDAASGATTLSFTGDATINRSDFGMGFGRPIVSNRVDLVISASFARR
jgi:polyisoprenoid-binding protein YceI